MAKKKPLLVTWKRLCWKESQEEYLPRTPEEVLDALYQHGLVDENEEVLPLAVALGVVEKGKRHWMWDKSKVFALLKCLHTGKPDWYASWIEGKREEVNSPILAK